MQSMSVLHQCDRGIGSRNVPITRHRFRPSESESKEPFWTGQRQQKVGKSQQSLLKMYAATYLCPDACNLGLWAESRVNPAAICHDRMLPRNCHDSCLIIYIWGPDSLRLPILNWPPYYQKSPTLHVPFSLSDCISNTLACPQS